MEPLGSWTTGYRIIWTRKDEVTVVSIPSRIIGEYITLKYMEEPGRREKLPADGKADKATRRFMENYAPTFPKGFPIEIEVGTRLQKSYNRIHEGSNGKPHVCFP